jgi:hypothetical protein
MADNLGIECWKDQFKNGLCTFNAYEAVGIRKDQPDTNVNVFAQDIILGATSFIGTVAAIALMYSGWLYINAKDSAAAAKGKQWVIRSFIGILLVIGAYTIIRGVQFLARG